MVHTFPPIRMVGSWGNKKFRRGYTEISVEHTLSQYNHKKFRLGEHIHPCFLIYRCPVSYHYIIRPCLNPLQRALVRTEWNIICQLIGSDWFPTSNRLHAARQKQFSSKVKNNVWIPFTSLEGPNGPTERAQIIARRWTSL